MAFARSGNNVLLIDGKVIAGRVKEIAAIKIGRGIIANILVKIIGVVLAAFGIQQSMGAGGIIIITGQQRPLL